MKIQDALDLHLKEEASRIIGETPVQFVAMGAGPGGTQGRASHLGEMAQANVIRAFVSPVGGGVERVVG